MASDIVSGTYWIWNEYEAVAFINGIGVAAKKFSSIGNARTLVVTCTAVTVAVKTSTG